MALKKWFWMLLLTAAPVFGQTLGYTPTPMGAFIGSGGAWTAWNATLGSQTLGYTPTPIGLYCSTNGTTWQPCNPTGGGGGATLPFPGIVYATSAAGGTVATSPQIVTALNASPSSTLATALIPATLPTITAPLNIGTPSITDTGVTLQMTGSANSYVQAILQNTNAGSAASADYVVNNNLGTSTTYYGDFGINSSAFTGTGPLNAANAIYVTGTSGNLVLGTTTANAIDFCANTCTTDAFQINSSNAPVFPGLTGYLYANAGSAVTAATTIPGSAISSAVSSATNLAGGAIGSLPYQSSANTTLFVSGNTAATDQVFTSTGTGSAAQAPTLKNAPALSAANMTGFPVIPVASGGTGTGSTLTGLMRGSSSAMTAAELSGDCTTSGSNSVTCLKTNGTAFTGYATATFVADTTVAVSSGSQGANSCSSATTVTMTGLTTSMVTLAGYSASPAALTGWGSTGGMVFQAWPSASNTLSWILCNQTASSISYSAITFNVGAR